MGKYRCLFLIILCPFFTVASKNEKLEKRKYEYLIENIDKHYQDHKNAWPYVEAYIKKAKIKNDKINLFYAYKEAAYFSKEKSIKFLYADSLISLSKGMKNKEYISQAYLSKGLIHYQFKELNEALNNYKLANNYVNHKTDPYIVAKINMNSAVIMIHMMQYDNAEKLLLKNLEYYENNLGNENFSNYYLNTLYYLGKVNQKNRNYKIAADYNRKGLSQSKQLGNNHFITYFNLGTTIDQFYKKKYKNVIQNSIPLINQINSDDFKTISSAYYYLGASYIAVKENEKASFYFKKIDSIVNKHKLIDIHYREVLEFLLKEEIQNNNKENQLYYINQLIGYDERNEEIIPLLAQNIHFVFTTPQLRSKRNQLQNSTSKYTFYVLGILVVSAVLYYKNKVIAKIKQIVTNKLKNTTDINNANSTLIIEQDIINKILQRLDDFEKSDKFINPDFSLNDFAKYVQSNKTYVSHVLNNYKKISFCNYIHALRIEYAIKVMQDDKKLSTYSIKALAKDMGFKNQRQFSNLFYKRTGMNPKNYINTIK